MTSTDNVRGSALVLRNLTYAYDGSHVLDGVDMAIAAGEYCVVLGRSGCGKSTLLKLIAGLLRPERGRIELNDHCINDVAPRHRDVSIAFQDDRLYPHWTLEKNLQIAVERSPNMPAKSNRNEFIREEIRDVAGRLNIAALLQRYPDQISGGQLKRAAVAKALLRRPSVCLLDEPLSAIDASMREDMIDLLASFDRNRGEGLSRTTIVHVTHDGHEAMRLADQVIVMGDGRVKQSGTPETVYRQPRTRMVATSLGSPLPNFLSASYLRKLTPLAPKQLAEQWPGLNEQSLIVVRPEDVDLLPMTNPTSDESKHATESVELQLPAIIDSCRYIFGYWQIGLRIKLNATDRRGIRWTALVATKPNEALPKNTASPHLVWTPGTRCIASVQADRTTIVEDDSRLPPCSFDVA